MSVDAPFSPQPPRAPDADLLKRSLRRPTIAVWLMGGIAALGLLNVWMAIGMNQLFYLLGSIALVILGGSSFFAHLVAQRRLREVWQSGVRTDVVLQKSLYFWTRAYRYRVELDDGRWASVILGSPSTLNHRLPALVAGDLIAVSDFGGCLKAGTLRRALQTSARVVAGG